jgi:predicted pyridoxine 5'-phosphate oxidase superfamily flavin-nucleotide-binding protein
MKVLPEKVNKAWDSRKDAVVLSTVDMNGMPNSIYVTCVSKYNESIIVVADNYFNKTRSNILAGSKASILFITNEGTSFQLKGTIKYHQSGEIFNDMKKWNPAQHPGNAAVALEIEEAYSGSEKLL